MEELTSCMGGGQEEGKLYLNVEGSRACDDLKQVVSLQQLSDGHTEENYHVVLQIVSWKL